MSDETATPIDWRSVAIAIRGKYRDLYHEAVERDCLHVQQWQEISAFHVSALQSQLAARDAEAARLREHVLDAFDCLDRVMGPRRPMTLPRKDEMRMAMDALRAALAAISAEGA